MGNTCSRRRTNRTRDTEQIQANWTRLTQAYGNRLREIATHQIRFTESSKFLRTQGRPLLDAATRGRRLRIL